MASERVRVWLDGDEGTQHLADTPGDDTSRRWEGTTVCGESGILHWVTYENVDVPRTCDRCVFLEGYTPPLEGDHPGPV